MPTKISAGIGDRLSVFTIQSLSTVKLLIFPCICLCVSVLRGEYIQC